MRTFLYVFLLIVASGGAKAQKQIDCTAEDSLQATAWLAQYKKQKTVECAPLWFAKKFLGRPYVGGTLERNSKELLVVNLREVDCTTLVNQVLALTLAAREKDAGFGDFCSWLQKLRYRNGVIDGYASRLHYYSEAISNHTRHKIFSEVGASSDGRFPFTGTQTLRLRYMSSNADKYRQLKGNARLTAQIAEHEKALDGQVVHYIPVKILAQDKLLKNYVRNGDILAIVTKKAGLDTSHLGFAVWKNGHLHLLNASSIHGKVVLEPMTLYQYMRKHPSQLGVRVIRLL